MTTIKKETLLFLKDLKQHNDREWFNDHKDRYIAAHENVIQFVQELIFDVAHFDQSVVGLDAKKTIFRIYRDTRFSKDKTPYKANFGAYLINKAKSSGSAGYYLHIEPGDCFLAGGIHMPEPAFLRAIRKEISAEGKKFLSIVNNKQFKAHFSIWGDQLKSVPQGFSKEDPMADYLRYKELTVFHPISEKELLSADFNSYCSKIFKLMKPFNDFMNQIVVEA